MSRVFIVISFVTFVFNLNDFAGFSVDRDFKDLPFFGLYLKFPDDFSFFLVVSLSTFDDQTAVFIASY